VTALRDTPAGTIRLTATENAAASVLLPALERFLPKYSDVKVEIVIDVGLTDIVAERFDTSVRFGELVADGVISVRIGPDARMAIVGAPSYFAGRRMPKTPQDLTDHNCINLRPPHGVIYAWEFEKAEGELKVHVDGQLVFESSGLIPRAGLALRKRRPSAGLLRRLRSVLHRRPILVGA
jgi:DNA-binding transcriptional LysR family regulator